MEQVPQQIGPYRVAEEIGRGRLTVVYRAMDTLYERVVALKVLPVYFAHDPALVRHFVSEGREAMRLQHPGVIQVYDAGQADGFTYLAQEWMSGGTLDEFLATQQGRLPHETVVAIVEQIAAGLDYAHHQGYIHRNLNPRNILFGERGQVKIADFSRGPLPRNTLLSNQLTGSPAFMAPEQARGDENLTAQADIYSLGVVTYHDDVGNDVADNEDAALAHCRPLPSATAISAATRALFSTSAILETRLLPPVSSKMR